jgi:transcriptional regulator with XRE-family HTH domain
VSSLLGTWLKTELQARSWSYSDLARAAGVQPATISRIILGRRDAGSSVCLAIAQALGKRPEAVYRLAGLLPPLPPSVEEEEEALSILRNLSARTRILVMILLRALQTADRQPPDAHDREEFTTAPEVQTGDADDWELELQLLEEFRRLPPEWQQHAIEEVERLQSLHTVTVRIIGDEAEDTESYEE